MTRRASRAKNRLGLVNKKKRHEIFAALFASGSKNFTHHSFRFAHPHVQNLRALDVHEVLPHLHACFFAKLLRQIISRGFSNKRLPTARRTIEKEAFWRGVLKFFEKVRM